MSGGVYSIDLGCMDYAACLQVQNKLHKRVKSGEFSGLILKVEHPAVITLGKNSSFENILSPREVLKKQGIAIVETDRGGEVTVHEPGQLVMYPLLSIDRFKLSPRKYIEGLESIVIKLLASSGLEAHIDQDHPGVWLGPKKICAIGVRFKERVTMHGLALNVANDLRTYQHVVPCGIQGRSICSMSELLSRPISAEEMGLVMLSGFREMLGCQISTIDIKDLIRLD